MQGNQGDLRLPDLVGALIPYGNSRERTLEPELEVKKALLGLESWHGGGEHLLLSQRTPAQFSAHTWWFTTILNPSSRSALLVFSGTSNAWGA